MKIGILTFHESFNYGTVFQAYALQHYLNNEGYEAELIRIERDFVKRAYNYNSKPLDYSIIQKIIIKVNNLLYIKDESRKQDAFNRFRKQMLVYSRKEYKTQKELAELYKDYDIFISGGDQIWNPYHKVFSEKYMFNMLPDSKKRLSYASSFGVERIEEIEILSRVKDLLSKYSLISVREKSGLQILHEIGLSGTQVLDPVFLLSKQEWSKYADSNLKLPAKYCVVYALVEYSFDDDKFIKKYAKKRGLDILIFPMNRRNQSTFYKKKYGLSPAEFLKIIMNAECVFTNSFHGAVFSLIFEKQLFLLNNVSFEARKKEGRIDDVLDLFNIKNLRIGHGQIDTINYDAVRTKIQQMREYSEGYLERNI